MTPIAADQACVAVIARKRFDFDQAMTQLPALQQRLQSSSLLTTTKGALTVSRALPTVTSGRVALIGEASGSADAITGEGLAMCFRQAVALGNSLAAEDLSVYEREHRKSMRLPQMMGRAMLLMDKNGWVRDRSLRALSLRPQIFDRMLSIHVGALPITRFGFDTAVNFGWQLLTAQKDGRE